MDWNHATVAGAPPAAGFVRLAVDDGKAGVFTAAYALRDSGRMTEADAAELGPLLEWFGRELRPHAPSDPAAVFWFRADATDHLARIWHLVRLLQRNDYDVRMWTARQVGAVLFEDAFQVAAVAHRDGRPAVKQLPAV